MSTLPPGLFDFLVERRFPNGLHLIDSVAARRREGEAVYVSRHDIELCERVESYIAEVGQMLKADLLALYEQEKKRLCVDQRKSYPKRLCIRQIHPHGR